MSSHGQGVGSLLQDIGKRTTRSLLNGHRQAFAGQREAEYVEPFGPGLHRVKNIGNPQAYVVGSTVGRVTFLPGQRVIVMSLDGGRTEKGEVIIGNPPPSSGGASAYGVKASVRDQPFIADPEPVIPPPPPPPDPDYDAFDFTGGSILATRFDEAGAYVADRHIAVDVSTILPNNSSGNVAYIQHDTAGRVEDGALAWIKGSDAAGTDTTIACFDPDGAGLITATLTLTPHWRVTSDSWGGVPVFVNGWLYWQEVDYFSDPTLTIRLRKCRSDLTSTQEVSSFTHTFGNANGKGNFIDGNSLYGTMFDSLDSSHKLLYRFPLNGSSPEVVEYPPAVSPPAFLSRGIPVSGGSFRSATGTNTKSFREQSTVSASEFFVSIWPTTGAWIPDVSPGSYCPPSADRDGAEVLVYYPTGSGSDGYGVRALGNAVTTTLVSSFIVAASPVPRYLFLRH